MKFPADIYLRSSYFYFHTNKKASLKKQKHPENAADFCLLELT